MPDLCGHHVKKAELILKNVGLEVEAVLFRESYEDQNVVLEQTPARGQMVYEGSRVTLRIARRGYMELLPAIYRRSDALGRNVVRDVCFVFEHMFGGIEERLDESHQYFDPHECPPEFLPWLASWTAMVVDMDWPESKKRAVVKRGVDIYRTRGTVRGLSLTLKLFTGVEPIIEENKWPFKGFRVGTEARVGLDSVVLPPVELAHCFMITMPMKFTDVTPEMVIRIHQLIMMEKPAHTHYYLQFEADKGDTELREFFAIGLRSGVGIGAEVLEGGGTPMGMGIGVAAHAATTSEPEPEPEPEHKATAKPAEGATSTEGVKPKSEGTKPKSKTKKTKGKKPGKKDEAK